MMDNIQGLRPEGRFIGMGADAKPLSISLIEIPLRAHQNHRQSTKCPEYLHEAPVSLKPTHWPKAYERVAEGKTRFRAPFQQCSRESGPVSSRLTVLARQNRSYANAFRNFRIAATHP
jgi:hypothetical protein